MQKSTGSHIRGKRHLDTTYNVREEQGHSETTMLDAIHDGHCMPAPLSCKWSDSNVSRLYQEREHIPYSVLIHRVALPPAEGHKENKRGVGKWRAEDWRVARREVWAEREDATCRAES